MRSIKGTSVWAARRSTGQNDKSKEAKTLKTLAFLVLTALALSGQRYKSGLHINVQSAFYDEARRAYEAVIAYDGNAPVTKDEIRRLYFRAWLFSPVQKAGEGIGRILSAVYPYSPRKYAESCLYRGEILENRPDGVRLVKGHLLPFTGSEAAEYDRLVQSEDIDALDGFFRLMEDRMRELSGAYTPENGIVSYFSMMPDGIAPIAAGAAFLEEDAVRAAFSLQTPGDVTQPLRSPRGVFVLEYLG